MTLKEFASLVKDMRDKQKKIYQSTQLQMTEEKVDLIVDEILDGPPLWISEIFLDSLPKQSMNLAARMANKLP